MTHAISRAEDPARGLQCRLLDLIADARTMLAEEKPSDEAIHRSRKSLKKARATLRLLRHSLPAAAFRRENRALRDLARPLGAARDASVLLATLDQLQKLYGDAAKASIPASFHTALKADQAKVKRNVHATASQHRAAMARFDRIETRVRRMTFAEKGWDDIGRSLKRTYRSGRRAMKQARATPTAECLHDWRKQTKYLWYQLQGLEPLRPGVIGEIADQAHQLSDYLGDDHDMAVLRDKATELADRFEEPGGAGPLLALIDRCRTRLQEKAFRSGARLYDESPRELAARFARYWKRWHAEDSHSS